MSIRTASEPGFDTRPSVRRQRPGLVGLMAGILAIGCCVYPVVLVLVGLSTATAAVDLGNKLFTEWGWAFKLAGVAFATAALVVQRRRARACPADARPNLRRNVLIVAVVGVATYGALYATTTWLGSAAT